MKVSGSVRFRQQPREVYEHIAGSVLDHALGAAPHPAVVRDGGTVLTQYETKLWRWIIVTTEEATLDPGRAITWRHVDGPLTRSSETFRFEAHGSGTLVQYEGDVRGRNRWFRGVGDWLFVAPMTRRVSLGSLRSARAELDRTAGRVSAD
jgi:hypothetical protein